ncbi:hypothetical protein OAT93_01945, partial [bacterium]|nr:hypothetical protein [bacterium]
MENFFCKKSAVSRIVFFLIVVMALLAVGDCTFANAQTRPDIRLVLQITVDGLRADLLNRYEDG